MKQLIPQSKIDESAKQLSLDTFGDDDNFSGDISTFTNGFNSGVQFALKEITPIIIEFKDWCEDNKRELRLENINTNNPAITTE